jgi:HEPN domain-containing protein
MPGREGSTEACQWLNVADYDLDAIRLCLRSEPLLAVVAAYHCQQALEKLAKAYLVLAGVRFRKTHSIDELAGLIEQLDRALAQDLTRLAWVTAWGFAHRYPHEEPEAQPTHEEIETVLAAAETLRASLETRLARD